MSIFEETIREMLTELTDLKKKTEQERDQAVSNLAAYAQAERTLLVLMNRLEARMVDETKAKELDNGQVDPVPPSV